MKNASFNTMDVVKACKSKLDMPFENNKESNGKLRLADGAVVRITVPKGRKPIPPKTYKSMARQLRLSVDQFDAFLECTFGKKDYEQELERQGVRVFAIPPLL